MLLALVFAGLIITQFIVPTFKDEQTWWLFRKNNTKNRLKKLYIQLHAAEDEQEIKRIEKEIKNLEKRK
jgi:hypothetical protein